MTSQTLTAEQFSELAENYAEWLLEIQDLRSLEEFFYDFTLDQLNSYTEAELLDEIKDFCPRLLEKTNGTENH